MKQAIDRGIAGTAGSPEPQKLALPVFLAPLLAVALLLIAAQASADEALREARGQVPLLTQGSSNGFAYSLSSTDPVATLRSGRPGADVAPPALRFGLGRELSAGGGAFSLGGAVDLARGATSPAQAWTYNRDTRPEFGPQLGYRSDPRSHFAAEVVGSYFYSRKRWVGHTFVGWRDNDGWAVGPEVWRLGTGLARSNGGGFAIHDIHLKPLNLGFRVGLETRSALGRRFIGGVELSWDQP